MPEFRYTIVTVENSTNKAASSFQEDLMANLRSSIQLIEHIPLLWTLRFDL